MNGVIWRNSIIENENGEIGGGEENGGVSVKASA